jgi:rubrerythrin
MSTGKNNGMNTTVTACRGEKMARIPFYSNYRVEVEPASSFLSLRSVAYTKSLDTHEEVLKTLQSIRGQIYRHVDDILGVSVEFDTKFICSHCNMAWEVAEDESWDVPIGCPICCAAAQDEYQDRKGGGV